VDLGLLGKGAATGFRLPAPVGPIGVLCIRRTPTEGRLAVSVTGPGAALLLRVCRESAETRGRCPKSRRNRPFVESRVVLW
jgi:hypothetical protein